MVKLSLLFVFIIVHSVKSELDPEKVIEAGFNVIKSSSNPLDFAKSVFDFATLLSSDNEEDKISDTLSVINDKLDDISKNLQSFKEEVISELKQIKLLVETKPLITKFFELGGDIDRHYNGLKRILKRNSTSQSLHYFINGVNDYYHGVTQTLERMHAKLYKDEGNIAYKYSTKHELVVSPVCPSRLSQGKTIQTFYIALHNAELKGLAVLIYALKQNYNNQTNQEVARDLEEVKQNFYERSNGSFTTLKETMSKISRVLWNCTLDSPREGLTYERFGPFIYKTYEPTQTISDIPDISCPHIKDTQSSCRKRPKSICDKFAYCPGKIKSCEKLSASVKVCHASNDKTRKYDYAETDSGKILGKKKQSCTGRVYKHQNTGRYLVGFLGNAIKYDITCVCTCENPDSNVYINLRKVASDVHKNKVVTGIRFRKVNDVFHLQVQQAKLLPSAAIDPKSKSWVKVEAYKTTDRGVLEGADYHKLSWDLRSFELDDVELDENYVVTGVRFTLDEGLIKLEVRGTEFHYETGKLDVHQNVYIRHEKSKKQLKYFELEDRDLPPEHPITQPVVTGPKHYTTLTTSDMDDDIGQSIVPFVDSRPIESENPDVALSGIGLLHKSYKKNAAGYLAPKILTYNFNA